MRTNRIGCTPAMLCLVFGVGWSNTSAADNSADKTGRCSDCLNAQAASQPTPRKADSGTFQAEDDRDPKPAVEPKDDPQVGKGRGRKDEEFARDRDTFHFLLENHKAIKRTVKKLDNGVETVTESDKPEVVKKIQEHVPAMYERLKSGKGVRYWDPLFAEAFKHGKKMKMIIENTKAGVKVSETSDEVEVVKIIQAHADTVSKFVEKGFVEAHKEHPVPGPGKK